MESESVYFYTVLGINAGEIVKVKKQSESAPYLYTGLNNNRNILYV